MDLNQLQTQFQKSLLSNDDGAIDLIVDDGKIAPRDRLQIYQQAYRLRLEEALQENFIGLHYLLGDKAFHDLCFSYIDQNPSRFTSVRWYGETLSDYLAQTSPYGKNPLLREMAEYEWKLLLAFDAEEKQSVSENIMASFIPDQWPGLRFDFHPSIQRADFKWSVVTFHNQVERHEQDNEQEIQAPAEAEYPLPWVIWRSKLMQKYRSLDVDEAWAIDNAMKGENFGYLCEGICEWVDAQHAPMRAAGFLKAWLQDGFLTNVHTIK